MNLPTHAAAEREQWFWDHGNVPEPIVMRSVHSDGSISLYGMAERVHILSNGRIERTPVSRTTE